MRFKAQFYAKALLAFLKDKKGKEREDFFKKVAELMVKNGDLPQKEKVLGWLEKYLREIDEKELLEIVSAFPLSSEFLEEIKKNFPSDKFIIRQKISEELLAGAKLILNENKELDASFRSLVDNLFKQKDELRNN